MDDPKITQTEYALYKGFISKNKDYFNVTFEILKQKINSDQNKVIFRDGLFVDLYKSITKTKSN